MKLILLFVCLIFLYIIIDCISKKYFKIIENFDSSSTLTSEQINKISDKNRNNLEFLLSSDKGYLSLPDFTTLFSRIKKIRESNEKTILEIGDEMKPKVVETPTPPADQLIVG